MTDKHYTLASPGSDENLELPVLDPTLGPSVLDIAKLYRHKHVFFLIC